MAAVLEVKVFDFVALISTKNKTDCDKCSFLFIHAFGVIEIRKLLEKFIY